MASGHLGTGKVLHLWSISGNNPIPVVDLVRSELRILPDPSRVIARPFMPGAPAFGDGPSRVQLIVQRILELPDSEVAPLLTRTRRGFRSRHADLEALWDDNAREALRSGDLPADIVTGDRHRLLGAYFTQEYAVEAAGVCNPSMVPAPGSDDGARFVMSLRVIGEGHISSVEFRTGSVGSDGAVTLDPRSETLTPGVRRSPTYTKQEFGARLSELDPDPDLARSILTRLPEQFSFDDLNKAVSEEVGVSEASMFETSRLIHWVATSNYEVAFSPGPLSERVLVPAGPADSQGIEDVRFVRFVDDDGTVTYYGTYTAFDGFTILPQLIETEDFTTFRVSTMSGRNARNKGMALFPRRVGGRYVALGRLDRESIFVMRSTRPRFWEEASVVYRPRAAWEIIQVGTCGPPVETERGWLVITHGVGAMRRYSLGAALLDLDNPERLIARSPEPILEPAPDERDGYVPNVVYSCGAVIHGGHLVIPYGFSDRSVGIARVALDDLLDSLTPA